MRCAACGEDVESYEVDLGGRTETRCLRCGLPLAKGGDGERRRFRRVLVADDSAFFTEAVAEILAGSGLAGEVLRARDGAEAVEVTARALRERRPISLAVIDLVMPRLNGFQAAVALRAVERAFGARAANVIFLSSRRLDPSLQPLLTELAPAQYVNKSGGDGRPLAERLTEVLSAVAGSAGAVVGTAGFPLPSRIPGGNEEVP